MLDGLKQQGEGQERVKRGYQHAAGSVSMAQV